MKYSALLFCLILSLVLETGSLHADKASEAYRSALASGDVNAVMRAESFLAPPYCYDINPWHGVTFTKAVNGRVAEPAYPFVYQDMTHLKVRMLYERAGIAEMEAGSVNELGLIRKISDWANMQWGHMQPLPYASWDALEILDRTEKGDAFWCTYKAALFVQACNAAGLTARMLGINRKHKDAHTVAEVYINDFRKWMLVDPWMNCFFEREGVPLSAREFHDSMNDPRGIFIVFGENGYGTEFWDFKTGKTSDIPHKNKPMPLTDHPRKGLIEYYHDIRIVLRNDHTTRPQPKENILIDGVSMVPYNARGGEWWGPQLHWTDDETPPLITCDNTGEIDDFEWCLNEVKVDLKKTTVPGEPVVLEATFSTLTPCFSSYDLRIDGVSVGISGNTYRWKLKKGNNSLRVASVNAVGKQGYESIFELDYDPSLVDFSRRVEVRLDNPGFEEPDPKSSDAKPANWGTITSNALGQASFELDSRVKHSGSYGLKASPAKDMSSGIEYAFIVKTATFEVNPATDMAYSVWLRADKENTPVDICLLDATSKGQGTYVKRILAGKEWKKYGMVCRLHNELTKAYVGFKVYTGTVWADDASVEEIGNLDDFKPEND